MKYKIFLIIMSVCFLKSTAQINRIEIGINSYKFYNVHSQPDQLNLQLRLLYSKEIIDDIKLYFEYNRLPLNATYTVFLAPPMELETIGKIEHIEDLNYFDIGGIYTLLNRKNFQINFNFGISTAIAKNTYLTNAIWSPPNPLEPKGHPIFTEYSDKTETYLGCTTGLKYDYFILANKFNIGLNISARYYLSTIPLQTNYGIQFGYNF